MSADSISYELIDTTEAMLHKFVEKFQSLYGLKHCSINVHQLLHLPQCVRDMGPLCDHLCYRYEDLNGQFLKSIHGTRHIDTQITRAHTQYVAMKRKLDELPEGSVKDFCLRKKQQVKLCEQLAENCYSVGTYSEALGADAELSMEVVDAIERSQGFVGNRIQVYTRLLKKGKLYVTKSYNKNMKTLSSYIHFKHNNEDCIGCANYFIKTFNDCMCMDECQCDPPVHYAIIRKFRSEIAFNVDINNRSVAIPYLFRCYSTDEILAVSIEQLISVCVYITVKKENGIDIYIGLPVNSKELE